MTDPCTNINQKIGLNKIQNSNLFNFSLFRVVFWNSAGIGWSIGKSEYLKSGSYWHKSGSDAPEPWMEDWAGDVTVECVGDDIEKDNNDDNGKYFTDISHDTSSL